MLLVLRDLLLRNKIFIFPIYGLFFGFLFSQDFQYPPEWHELFSDSGWTLITKKERIRVFEKPILVSPVPAFRVELVTPVSTEALLNVAWAVDQYPETLSSAYIVKAGFNHRNSAQHQQGWQIMDIPFLAPRLYQFDHIRHLSRIDWISTQFNHPEDSPEQLIIPPVNFGSWEVLESDGETKLIYRVCTNPGGVVPSWIVRKTSRNYIPDMLLELEEAALNGVVE
ncbi:MAG TPA: hypothetical protein EYN02_03925 [Candidatus Marinimicrobia bacterium]|nr:hypothetical protein [Candidatus Neomarinimicrobiota bacterium]